MFTGIIDNKAEIIAINKKDLDLDLTIKMHDPYIDIKIGDSIACDGMCISVTEFSGDVFSAYLSAETLAKTISQNYKIGSVLNLERPVKVGGRLDGHYVTGHVDNFTKLLNVKQIGESWSFVFARPAAHKKFLVEKGAICLNGVSLTVNDVSDQEFTVNIIPITYTKTNFSRLNVGDIVNYEVDILAKYFCEQK